MDEVKKVIRIYILFLIIFFGSVVIFRKKVESIILEREIYLAEIEKRELLRKNLILKTEIAKRKSRNKESLLYYWQIYKALPDYENQKSITIRVKEDKK